MEVFSIITSDKQVQSYFDQFIYNYSKLKLKYKDIDTSYFINVLTGVNEIYYHYTLISVEEYKYNYSDSDRNLIENYFDGSRIYIFDLQFKNVLFLKELLDNFKKFVKDKYTLQYQNKIKVLYSDPKNGISEW